MGGFVKASSVGGVTDHGALTGLGDDDHPQYMRTLDVQEGGVSVVSERIMTLDYDAADFNVSDAGGGEADISLAVTPIAGIDVQEGGGSVVGVAGTLNFVAADFDVSDETGGVAGIALAITPIAGIDVQEGGGSVVGVTTALNFVADDFDISDETGGVAGIALSSGLVPSLAGVFLAIDGTNRMQTAAEIRSLWGVLDFETGTTLSDITDEFDDDPVNPSMWYEGPVLDPLQSQSINSGTYSFDVDTTTTVVGAQVSLHSRWTLQGDVDVVARFEVSSAGGSSGQRNYAYLLIADAGDWGEAVTTPPDPEYARMGGGLDGGTPAPRFIGRITGTASAPDVRSNTDFWLRIVRTGTSIEMSYNDAGGAGGDTVPGSWTVLHTKGAAGLDDEIVVGIMHTACSTGATLAAGSYARCHRIEILAADTINASGSSVRGWQMDLSTDIDDGGTLLDIRYDTSTAAKPGLSLISQTDGAELRLFDDAGTAYGSLLIDANDDLVLGVSAGTKVIVTPGILDLGATAETVVMSDAGETAGETLKLGVAQSGAKRVLIAMSDDIGGDSGKGVPGNPTLTIMDTGYTESLNFYHDGSDGQIIADGKLHLQNNGLGNLEIFATISASASNRKFVLYGHDDTRLHDVEIYHDGDWFWIANLEALGEGMIFRSEPGIWRFQTGSTVHSNIDVTSSDTCVLNLGTPAAEHGELVLSAKTTATTQSPVIKFERLGNDGTYLNIAAHDTYRLSVWENVDPDDLSGTPEGFLPVVRAKSGSDWGTGDLVQDVDFGWRTDAPEDRLFFNAAGNLRTIGMGACAAFAGIYNHGTETLQTVGTGASVKVTQFTTAFATDRSMTADVANDEIDVTETGLYIIAGSAGFFANGGAKISLVCKIDGSTDIPMSAGDSSVLNANDHTNIAFFGFVTLTAATSVAMYVSHNQGGDVDITIDDAQLCLVKIGNAA